MKSYIKARIKILKNNIVGNRRSLAKGAFIGGLGLFFMFLLYFGTFRSFQFLLSIPELSPLFVMDFAERLLAMVYLLVFAMLFFSNLTTSLSAQYTGEDLTLLHSLPLGSVRIFFLKFLETTLVSSYIAVVFPLPILLATGKIFSGDWLYYCMIPAGLVVFALIPAALGSLGTLLLMRVLPAEKTSRLLTLLGLVFVIIIAFTARFMHPEELFQTSDTDDLKILLQRVALPAVPYLPSTWSARFNISLLEGAPLAEGFLPFGGLAASALVACLILFGFAKIFYFNAWGGARLTEHITYEKKKLQPTFILDRLLAPFHSHTRAILKKDIIIFFRDASQWSQLLLLFALIILYLYNIASLPFPQEILRNALSFINIAMAGFVLSAVAARFAYPAISAEGRSAWILYSAPIDLRRVIFTKCITAFLPLFALSVIIVIASNMIIKTDWYMFFLSVALIFFITLALTGLGVGMGAGMPMWDAESPARVAVSGGALLYISISLVYIALVMALSARPVYYHFVHRYLALEFGAESMVYYALIALLSVGLFIYPLIWGSRRMASHEV